MKDYKCLLTVLGSGSAVPYENRVSSSYLVEFENTKILLDAGFCVVYRLADIGVSLDDIDTVFITHKHPDHFMGLIHFLFALKNPIYKNRNKLQIYGFKGLGNFLDEFKNILGKWICPEREIEIIEEYEGKFKNINYRILPVFHTEESVGIYINGMGKSLFYTGDTEYFESLTKGCSNIDLLIADCAANKKNIVKGHMNFEEVIRLGMKISAKKILFSHFYPDSDKFEINALDYDFIPFKAYDLMKILI